MKRCTLSFAAVSAAAAVTTSAPAGSHLWEINEAFSNADGTIQFVEMKECCGANNEWFLINKWVKSVATGNQYVFPESLCMNCTAEKHILLATAGFAALPEAPTPDHIIPDNFFSTAQDTIEYYFYDTATMEIALFALPLDGVNSLDRDGVIAVNSPTNFDDDSGSVIAACHRADLNNNGSVDFGDILAIIANWGDSGLSPYDLSGNGIVDFVDILQVVGSWGPC